MNEPRHVEGAASSHGRLRLAWALMLGAPLLAVHLTLIAGAVHVLRGQPVFPLTTPLVSNGLLAAGGAGYGATRLRGSAGFRTASAVIAGIVAAGAYFAVVTVAGFVALAVLMQA